MKILQQHIKITSFICLLFFVASCAKEKKWSTEINTIQEDEPGEIIIEADFNLQRNDNYVYVGIAINTKTNPTINNLVSDKQMLDSDTDKFYFDGLESYTKYYTRSYIITKSGEVIYSEEKEFVTNDGPAIPCEPELGKVEYNGTSISMADLSDGGGEYYSLDTYSGFGDLTFTFLEKPTSKMYKTVSSEYDLTAGNVKVEGILGYGFSCYYSNMENLDVYVTIDESLKISIAFCDLKLATGGSCEDFYLLTGEVHE